MHVDREISASGKGDRIEVGRAYIVKLCNEDSDSDEDLSDSSPQKIVQSSKYSSKVDCNTITTLSDSLDSNSFGPPWLRNEMSVLINGTHYVGSMSSTTSSACDVAGDCEGMHDSNDRTSTGAETRKEQSRRLLKQHREFIAWVGKPK